MNRTGNAIACVLAAFALACASAEAAKAPSFGIWEPGPEDSCSKALHDSFSVKGPDGLRYPTWHPPVHSRRSGEVCTFGHEHGRNPKNSDLLRWVAKHSSAESRGDSAGIPFGYANRALDIYAEANPGTPTRHEDHVGHKIEWENDAILYRTLTDGSRQQIGIRCDFLTKIHQGTHSADAFGINVHELLYAVRCTDGTKLIATKLVNFGAPNQFTRSCDKTTLIGAGTSHGFETGGGARLIPDRACAEEFVLVPQDSFSQYSVGLYEDWISSNYLRTAEGHELAYFDPHFAVFNPSRFAGEAAAPMVERTIGLCTETEQNGDEARGGACEPIQDLSEEVAFNDDRSPFDGAHREVYFNQTIIANEDGPKLWWTDPYGGNASPRPFAGGVCQLVGSVDNRSRPNLESQAFGAARDYGAPGVHAPN